MRSVCAVMLSGAVLLSVSCLSESHLVGNTGDALFLTPYIEEGRIAAAKEASKVSTLIEGDVESYSGYLTVNSEYNSNLFFWFFPAEKGPSAAPVALWLQGGPGISSLFGIFWLNGPFTIMENSKMSRRPHYWSQKLNMVYIDNPVGTGFSFTDNELGYARNETDVGRDLYAAMVQFFQLFPEYQSHEFFITGESYAGKFVPALARTIHQNNPGASVKINLVGMSIGNGWIDPRNMMLYSDYLFQLGLIDDNTKVSMKQLEERTVELIDQERFHAALQAYEEILKLMKDSAGPISKYDYMLTGNTAVEAALMDLEAYVNQPHARRSLHVGNRTFSKKDKVQEYLVEDMMKSAAPWLEELLEQYRVLLYNGQLDIRAAYPLTVNFIKQLRWSGSGEYLEATRKLWWVGNELAGYAKSAKNFTEVLVRNAAHLVPAYQPVWALDLIIRFTRNIPFDRPADGIN